MSITPQEETVWLLIFFSRPQREQWAIVPQNFPISWVRVRGYEFECASPIRVLASILASALNGWPEYFPSVKSDILSEVRILLHYWMLESVREYVFDIREEACDEDMIWLTLARLCRIAIGEIGPNISTGLECSYFLQQYTVPIVEST